VRIPGFEATMRAPTRIDSQFTSTNFVTQGGASTPLRLATSTGGIPAEEDVSG